MKLRCLLGLHGPIWCVGYQQRGPYSVFAAPMYRQCPHCKKLWGGIIGERGGYRDIVAWERVSEVGK